MLLVNYHHLSSTILECKLASEEKTLDGISPFK